MKVWSYIRLSTNKQELLNQSTEIKLLAKRENLKINETIKIKISSKKNSHERKLDYMIDNLKKVI